MDIGPPEGMPADRASRDGDRKLFRWLIAVLLVLLVIIMILLTVILVRPPSGGGLGPARGATPSVYPTYYPNPPQGYMPPSETPTTYTWTAEPSLLPTASPVPPTETQIPSTVTQWPEPVPGPIS